MTMGGGIGRQRCHYPLNGLSTAGGSAYGYDAVFEFGITVQWLSAALLRGDMAGGSQMHLIDQLLLIVQKPIGQVLFRLGDKVDRPEG